MQIGEKKNIVTSEKIHIFYLFEKDYWVLCRSFEDCPDLYKGIELPKSLNIILVPINITIFLVIVKKFIIYSYPCNIQTVWIWSLSVVNLLNNALKLE